MGITTNPIPVKAALALAGHRVGSLRLPFVEASDEERAQLPDVLERHGLLAAAERDGSAWIHGDQARRTFSIDLPLASSSTSLSR